MIYKVVAQSVLMYSSESWVVIGSMLKVLEGFHHQASIHITGMTVRHVADGDWEYTLVVATLKVAVLYPIQDYIFIRQAIIAT